MSLIKDKKSKSGKFGNWLRSAQSFRHERITHAGSIPYLVKDDKVFIALLRDKSKKKSVQEKKSWKIPKGQLDMPGLSNQEVAAVEAYEEAGLLGVVGEELGYYTYRRKRKDQKKEFNVQVFPFKIIKVLDTWHEDKSRERQFFTVDETALILKNKQIELLLSKLVQNVEKEESLKESSSSEKKVNVQETSNVRAGIVDPTKRQRLLVVEKLRELREALRTQNA
ncbi:NUDIX domain-containing protein [Deltaproteobacteria bacterium TL4]